MLFTEFNIDDAKMIWQEEAGEAKAKAIALAMLKNGFAPDIVAANTESPVSKITELAARITVQNSC